MYSLIGLAFALSAGPEGSWMEFRGQNGTGIYSGPALPAKFGPGVNQSWKTTIPGHGWSSPIFVKGKLYLTSAVTIEGKPDKELRVICVDATTGKIEWNQLAFTQTNAPNIHKKNSHASPTPVSDGELVVAHFGHMGTACYDLKGKQLWKTQKYSYKPVHGNGGSPVLVDDAVVFSCDGNDKQMVVALNKKTGEELWNTDRKTSAKKLFSFSTPQPVTVDGKSLILSPASEFVGAYDAKTGSEVWKTKYPAGGYSVIPQPVIGHGMAYIGTGYDSPQLIAVNLKTHEIAWASKKNAPHTPTPVLVGDELYTVSDSGFMSCYNAKTGDVYWSERLKGKGYSSSPIVADKLIYIVAEDGVCSIVSADTKELKVNAEIDFKEKCFATPLPVDGSLYIRTETSLYRFATKK